MSNCPASELLKQRRIPAFTPPNDASEAICKLPAKIPSMAASDIQSTYNFRPDEINEPISPLYYTVSQEPVSSGAADADDCVETTDVSSDSFTWVDWLTPITGIEGDRSWILAGESLNCTDNGDLSNSTTFKRPALPITQFGSVLPAPITAPISVASALGGGGGGGGTPPATGEELVEIVDNKLIIHPIYIIFNQGYNSIFEYICGDDTQQLADNRSIKVERFPVDFSAQVDGTYYVWLYRSGRGTDDNDAAIYSMGFFATTTPIFDVKIPSCLFQLVAAVSVNAGKVSISRIFCSKAQNADVYCGAQSKGEKYEPYGVYFTLSGTDSFITPSNILLKSIYIDRIIFYPINTLDHSYDYFRASSSYTQPVTLQLNDALLQKFQIAVFLDREKKECVLDTTGTMDGSDRDVVLYLYHTDSTITGSVSSIIWYGYPYMPSVISQSFIIKVYPDYSNGTKDSLPFTVRIQQASDTSEYAGRVRETGATNPILDQYIPVYEESFVASSTKVETVYFYINLYADKDNNTRYCKISKKQTMGSVLIGSVIFGDVYVALSLGIYPNIFVDQVLITNSVDTAVDLTPAYIGSFCILSVEETDDNTYGYLVNPGGSTVPTALTSCYVNGYNSTIDTCSPFYFSTTATYGYAIITFVPADLDISTGAVINNAHISISVRTAGTPPDTTDPMNVRSIFMRFNRTAAAATPLLPLPATPLQFVYAEAPSTTVLEAEIAKHMETP